MQGENETTGEAREIVVIDDDQRQRSAIAGLLGLRFKQHECREFATANEALLYLEKNADKVDACLLDWHLGGNECGGVTLKQLRKKYTRLPVLVFTASEDVGEQAYRAGASFYIPRPLDPSLVVRCVEALLTMRELGRETEMSEKQVSLLTRANELGQYLYMAAVANPEMSEHDVSAAVAQFLFEKLGYARVRVYLVHNGETYGAVSRGMHPGFDLSTYRLFHDDPNATKAFQLGAPVIIPREELQHDRFYTEFRKDGVENQLMVPLLSGTERLGLIVIDEKEAECPLDDDDLAVMSLASSAIAGALREAGALTQSRREKQWLECLLEIDKVLTSTPNIDKVLQSVVDKLTPVAEAEIGVVLTRSHSAEPLSVVAASTSVPDEVYEVEHEGTFGRIGECLDSRSQVFCPDISEDALFQQCVQNTRSRNLWQLCLENTGAVVIEPVICGNAAIGVLILGFRSADFLSNQDLEFFDDVALRVSIAMAKLNEARQFKAVLLQRAKLNDLALLTAGIAHGVRNPLQTVKAAVESIQAGADEADITTDLEVIQSNLEVAFDQVNRLVKWATPQGPHNRSVNVVSLIRDLVSLVDGVLHERRIRLHNTVPREVPLVAISEDSLRVVFDDLIWNAAKAMPDGGDLTITVDVSADNEAVVIVFSDNGRGMTADKIRQVFHADTSVPPPAGGVGLGVYLASKVVEAADGSLECKSSEGKGTTVTVCLPCVKSGRTGYEHE